MFIIWCDHCDKAVRQAEIFPDVQAGTGRWEIIVYCHGAAERRPFDVTDLAPEELGAAGFRQIIGHAFRYPQLSERPRQWA